MYEHTFNTRNCQNPKTTGIKIFFASLKEQFRWQDKYVPPRLELLNHCKDNSPHDLYIGNYEDTGSELEELIKPLTSSIEKNNFDWKKIVLDEIETYNTKDKTINEKTRKQNAHNKIDYQTKLRI